MTVRVRVAEGVLTLRCSGRFDRFDGCIYIYVWSLRSEQQKKPQQQDCLNRYRAFSTVRLGDHKGPLFETAGFLTNSHVLSSTGGWTKANRSAR